MEKLNQKEKIKKTIEEEKNKIKLLHKVNYTKKEILFKSFKNKCKKLEKLSFIKIISISP